MLKIDKLQGQPLVLAKGFYRLYGPRGLITRLIPRYLDWFKPGFHPSDTEIPEKVNSGWLNMISIKTLWKRHELFLMSPLQKLYRSGETVKDSTRLDQVE